MCYCCDILITQSYLSGAFRLDPKIKVWEKIHLHFLGLDIVQGYDAEFSKNT